KVATLCATAKLLEDFFQINKKIFAFHDKNNGIKRILTPKTSEKKQKGKDQPHQEGHGTHISHREIMRRGKVPADGTNVPTNGKEFTNNGTNDKNMGNKRKIQTQNGEKQVSKQKATSHKKERKQA
ncbi:MAG: hypothetical protein IKH63_04030, partial [Prevotella sp.]|nr:hypothetical protein [Prevotella sp.]